MLLQSSAAYYPCVFMLPQSSATYFSYVFMLPQSFATYFRMYLCCRYPLQHISLRYLARRQCMQDYDLFLGHNKFS